MRRVNSLLVYVCALIGCAGAEERAEPPIRNVGISEQTLGSASGTPPLGEAIAPVVGGPGDGSPVVTAVGGWSSGPGAVRWHGGQWVMPYAISPGATLLNVSCDVWNPTTAAPANVLVEVVSSNGQVLGSAPPVTPSAQVVTRAWPFVGAHAVVDGEQLVVRISARDATTGAWTSAAQDVTVIGCAVNSTRQRTLSLSPHAWVGLHGTVVTYGQSATIAGGTALVAESLGLPVGSVITALRVAIIDSANPRSQVAAELSSTTPSGQEIDIVSTPTSSGTGSPQVLAAGSLSAIIQPATCYWIMAKMMSGNGSVALSGTEIDYIAP
jgi:hypothetical protein